MAMRPRKSKPLRVALAGAGMISRHHLIAWRNLGERVKLVAVCDPDEAKASQRAGEFSNFLATFATGRRLPHRFAEVIAESWCFRRRQCVMIFPSELVPTG